MSKLLFKLRHVPDDEAEDVRQLLAENNIEVYETSAGNWGISMPALWIQDEGRFEEAKALVDDYQRRRSQRVRQEYEELQQSGQSESMITFFLRSPLRFIFYSALIVVVIYLSTGSFFSF